MNYRSKGGSRKRQYLELRQLEHRGREFREIAAFHLENAQRGSTAAGKGGGEGGQMKAARVECLQRAAGHIRECWDRVPFQRDAQERVRKELIWHLPNA